MNVPQLASSVRGRFGMYSLAVQMEPSGAMTVAE